MITDPEQWVDQALAELASYHNQPFLFPFMKRWGLDSKDFGSLKARIAAIKRCILAPDHPLRLCNLAAELDNLKSNGRQLIFLWRLKPGEERYLQELAQRHPERSDFFWEAEVPELAEVRRDGEVLRYKWIASRHFFVAANSAQPDAPPKFVPKTQRSATFFSVDLVSGEAELRIQSVPAGRELPSHREEFERYRGEVKKVVELDRFAPVLIEPVASEWLRTPPHGLAVTRWTVARPSGEYLEGGGRHQRNLAGSLSLIFSNYAAKRVTLRWDCPQTIKPTPLFFSLDGFEDGVDFNGRADASRVDFLLDKIRNGELPSFHMRELGVLAEKHPEHARILSILDHHFSTLQSLRVSAGKVAEEVWYDVSAIVRVFELAAAEFPKAFTLQGDVLVLKNQVRVREGGVVEALERFAKARRRPRLRALVKPAMVIATPLAFVSYDVLLEWLWSWLLEELTGVSFENVEVTLVALVGLLHLAVVFGGRWIEKHARRLLEALRSLYNGVQSLRSGGELLMSAIEAEYREWLSSRAPAAAPESPSDHWKAAA